MQNSFYGGQPGVSFIIVIAYESISEMVENFQKGPNYEAVHFDEHVLINTGENKNDPDNGKIFRRGYDYTNEMGGAIYVGTIVGPAGRAPMLEMTTIEDVKSKQAQEGYDYRYSEGSYAPFDNLIPGRDGEEYNDEIQWACCSIRDELSNDTIAYIGFIFPYTVIDYEASTVNPYYNRSNDTDDFTNENLVDRIDAGEHPYWEKWHISVPKGIKGDAFENFRVITASDDDGVEAYDGQADDRANGREILVYDYYHFDKEEGGEPVTIYLGDYNMVTGIIVNEDGTITITYTHDDNVTFDKAIRWIDNITLDPNGTLTMHFNTGEETVWENILKWITSVELTEEGHFAIEFNNGDDAYETDLVWVTEVSFDEQGMVTVHFNNGTTQEYPNIKWITEISLTEDGSFHIGFNNGDEYNTNLTWINYITIDNDGTIHIVDNQGNDVSYEQYIKMISDVSINTGDTEGTGNQKVHIKYNTGEEEDIGEPLNYIMRMEMVDSNYHLLVWYSDPAKRQEIIDEGKSYVFEGEDGWLDLGSVKDESGILIGTNYEYDLPDEITQEVLDEIASLLDSIYPNGLQGTDLKGKVVTVGNDNTESKLVYAYDYDSNNWYYIGDLSGGNVKVNNAVLFDQDPMTKEDTLQEGGAWFVIEDYSSILPHTYLIGDEDTKIAYFYYKKENEINAIIKDFGFSNYVIFQDFEDYNSTPPWVYRFGVECQKVIFDSSFKNVKLKNGAYLFQFYSNGNAIQEFEGLEYFDTSEMVSMREMFIDSYNITDLDLSHFNTSKCTDFYSMFAYMSQLKTLDLSSFDISQCINFESMFEQDTRLETIYVSKYDDWNNYVDSSLVNYKYLFSGTSALTGYNPIQEVTCSHNSSQEENFTYARVPTSTSPYYGWFTLKS